MIGLLTALALAGRPEDWDWTGVVGTGQSLSVGGTATPIPSSPLSFGTLNLDNGDLAWPADPNDPRLKLVPRAESPLATAGAGPGDPSKG